MNFSELEFDRLYGLYLLIAIPLFLLLFWRLNWFRRKALERYSSPEHSLDVVLSASSYNRWIQYTALCMAWIGVVVAFMGPKGSPTYREEEQNQGMRSSQTPAQNLSFKLKRKAHDVIFVLDVSSSMGTTDTRIGKSRLDYAKEIIEETISDLKGENGALDVFTSEVFPKVPPTLDYLYLQMVTDRMRINEGNTTGSDFLQLVNYLRDRWEADSPKKLKSVVLLTDGGDTELEGLKGQERQEREDSIIDAIGDPKVSNVRLFVIGMGSKKGGIIPNILFNQQPVHSVLEEGFLKKLTKAGRGDYIYANDETPIEIGRRLYQMISQDVSPYDEKNVTLKALGIDNSQDIVYELYYQFPLGLAILCLAIALLVPERSRKNHA